MHNRKQLLRSLYPTLSLAILAALLTTLAIVPASAQNSVPPTAVQAAKMPQYASRLAHPGKRLSTSKPAASPRVDARRGPLDPIVIYANGNTNGNTDAWDINLGFSVSNSFLVEIGNGATVTGMTFAAWVFPGDTLTSAELSITSSPFGGTSYFDQTVSFIQSGCIPNQYNFNVCNETATFKWPTP